MYVHCTSCCIMSGGYAEMTAAAAVEEQWLRQSEIIHCAELKLRFIFLCWAQPSFYIFAELKLHFYFYAELKLHFISLCWAQTSILYLYVKLRIHVIFLCYCSTFILYFYAKLKLHFISLCYCYTFILYISMLSSTFILYFYPSFHTLR